MNYTADPLIKIGLRPDYSEAFNEMNNAIAGIATTSSSFWEANNGGIRYQGHIAVGQGSVDTVPPLSVLGGTTSTGTSNYDSFTNGSLTQNALVLNAMHIDATANNAAGWIAQNGLAEIKVGNNKNYTGLVAGDGGAVYHYGTGTITEFDAVFAVNQNNSSGVVTNSQGVRAIGVHNGSGAVINDYGVSSMLVQVSGSNAVTTHHGVHISNPVIFAGSVGTNVGLYVESHTSGTTDYNIYSAGSSSTNLFEGNVSIGGDTTISDAKNIILNTTTGTKIGTATSQKLGFWNATPIVQPTTVVAAATFTANTSGIANDTATFDGYTIGQVVKALRNTGILA